MFISRFYFGLILYRRIKIIVIEDYITFYNVCCVGSSFVQFKCHILTRFSSFSEQYQFLLQTTNGTLFLKPRLIKDQVAKRVGVDYLNIWAPTEIHLMLHFISGVKANFIKCFTLPQETTLMCPCPFDTRSEFLYQNIDIENNYWISYYIRL